MLLLDPTARPPVAEVHAALMGLRIGTPAAATATVSSLRPAGRAASRLRGKGLRFAGDSGRPTVTGPTSSGESRRSLLGKLIGKLEERRER